MLAIRPPIFAGSFYPKNDQELKKLIKTYLKKVPSTSKSSRVKALIVPHAGYLYSGQTAAFGYQLINGQNYKNIILIGPSHKMMFQNIALTNFSLWQTPLGNIIADPLYKKLETEDAFNLLNETHTFEHSIEVQLPFLKTVLEDFKITPIITGRVANHKEVAKVLAEYLDEQTLIIISSDLSHYLPYKQAVETDKETIKQILNLNTEINPKQACGADGIVILTELAKLYKWKPKLLDYRNSGDTTGDKDRVVGYTSIAFYK